MAKRYNPQLKKVPIDSKLDKYQVQAIYSVNATIPLVDTTAPIGKQNISISITDFVTYVTPLIMTEQEIRWIKEGDYAVMQVYNTTSETWEDAGNKISID